MITASVPNSDDFLVRLRKLYAGVRDLRRPFDLLGDAILAHTTEGFRAEKDPWGKSWEPNSGYTLANRITDSDRIHYDTGGFYGSFSKSFVNDGMEVGTDFHSAEKLHFGLGDSTDLKRAIPSRPVLPILDSGEVSLPAEIEYQMRGLLVSYIKGLMT